MKKTISLFALSFALLAFTSCREEDDATLGTQTEVQSLGGRQTTNVIKSDSVKTNQNAHAAKDEAKDPPVKDHTGW